MKASRKIAYSGHCRAIVSDIDGTFLTNDKQLIAKNLETISLAKAKGVPFLFSTGRMFGAIAPWVRQMKLTAPQILNNGADVILPADLSYISHQCLSREVVMLVMEECANADFVPILFSGMTISAEVYPEDAWLIERNNEIVKVMPQDFLLSKADSVEKIVILSYKREPELVAFSKNLLQKGRDSGMSFMANFSEYGILSVCSTKSTKSQAIQAVCGFLGCTMADVMAVGDGDNDADMLEAVGLGVAMGNATPLAQSCSLVQVADNEHAGLAEAIQRFVINCEQPNT